MSEKPASYVITVGDHISLPHEPNDTVLESLEKHNVEVHYHCREGFCGACRCVLKSGEIEYTIDPLAYINDNEILMCCSKPMSDIEITLI